MFTAFLYTICGASVVILAIFFNPIIIFLKRYFRSTSVLILHKSQNFIIVEKPFDLKINSNNSNEETVQTLVKKLFPLIANEKLFHEFYFPHRLDYATSGILCIPVHKQACATVSEAFSNRRTKKYYTAIVRGLISQEMIDIDVPIGEDTRGKDIQKMCTTNSKFCIKPKSARTVIIILEKGIYDGYPATKILTRLITGRRHQIRVHCCSLGHTIVGDFTYSNRKDVQPPRMFLHACRIVLPNNIENIDIETKDPFESFKDWKTIHTINNFNSAYNKLDAFVDVCD